MTNDIFWSMERKEVTAVIVLNMSAAFDTVDHDLLLDILHNRFGIADTALQWYQSYLRPQGMKVCINDAYSSISHLITQFHREVQVAPTYSLPTVPQSSQ